MRNPLEIPEPGTFEVKEVFAFFGLAAYHAQVCEKGFVNMAVVIQAQGAKITASLWEGLFGQFDKRTFGQLLREIRKICPIGQQDEALFQDALDKRNWIAHQFFADFSVEFMIESGRKKMIEELRAATLLFMKADVCASGLYAERQKALGLTDDVIARLIEQAKAEYIEQTEAPVAKKNEAGRR